MAAALVLSLLAACAPRPRQTEPAASRPTPEAEPLPAPVRAPAEPAAPPSPPQEGAASGAPTAHQARLAVYRFDPDLDRLWVSATVEVAPGADRSSVLQSLLAWVNSHMSERKIRLAGTRREDSGEILLLDLVDQGDRGSPAGWYQSFQGSAGGAATQAFLVATFLQQRYPGEWFDGVQFLLNGKPMAEMDHVNLSAVFLRETPLERYVPVAISGPAEPTDQEVSDYLRNTLELAEGTRITLARLQTGQEAETIAFFTAHPNELARQGVVRVSQEVPAVLSFGTDPCNCQSVQARAVQLVRGRGKMVVTRFSPMTGTCVGLEAVRILAAGEDGALMEVWQGSTFQGEGTTSRVSSVQLTDLDGDGDQEILWTGKVVDCGDGCLCREGPVVETFRQVYHWDGQKQRFVAAR